MDDYKKYPAIYVLLWYADVAKVFNSITLRLYDGSEVVVAGKFKNDVEAPSDGKSPRGEIIGRTATQKRNFKIEFPKPVSRLNINPVRQESPIRESHSSEER